MTTRTPDSGGTLAAWLTPGAPAPLPSGGHALPRVAFEGEGAALQLGDVLGEGGMAVVRRAREVSLDREVAVKRTRRPGDPASVAALLREAAIGARLQHPNIVPVYSVGETEEGEPVVVMRAVGGLPWDELARVEPGAHGHLDRHLAVFGAVCQAVSYAHGAGIVHRDIKPANVRVGEFGEVYLLDWGVAAELSEPSVRPAGTPAYMAPEACVTGPPDARSDVFGLAATLVAALTGEHPVRPDPTGGLVVPRALPEGLARVLERAGAADPAQRPPTVEALRREVAAWQEDQVVEALMDEADAQLALLDDEPTRAREQFAVARFAHEQVLRARPQHARARAGLATCYDRMVRAELGAGRVDAAEGWLASHPSASPALVMEVAQVRADHDARAAEADRDRAVARFADITGARSALWQAFLALFGLAVVTVAAVNALLGSSPEAWRMAIIPLPPMIVAAAILLRRRHTFTTVAARRSVVAVLCMGTAILAGRIATALFGLTLGDQPAILAYEPLLLVMMALGMLPSTRRAAPTGAFIFAGWIAVLLTMQGPWIVVTYNVTVLGGIALLAWSWADAQREVAVPGA